MKSVLDLVKENGEIEGKNPKVHKSTGYLRFHHKGECYYVHRVVAEKAMGPANELHVNHIDGNKLNNHPSNLEYVTRGGNAEHAHRTGLINAKGESNGRAVLDWAKVRKIRSDKRIARLIAKDYGVSISLIYEIKSGRCWKE